jgi:hypothetical protein
MPPKEAVGRALKEAGGVCVCVCVRVPEATSLTLLTVSPPPRRTVLVTLYYNIYIHTHTYVNAHSCLRVCAAVCLSVRVCKCVCSCVWKNGRRISISICTIVLVKPVNCEHHVVLAFNFFFEKMGLCNFFPPPKNLSTRHEWWECCRGARGAGGETLQKDGSWCSE